MNNQEILVSLCQNMTDKQPVAVPVTTVVELIRSDQSTKESTEKYRYAIANGFDKDAKKEKKHARQFIPSAICEGGADAANVKSHTGLGMGDWDELPSECIAEYMKRLEADSYVFLSHITYSGTGIRVIYRTDATEPAQHPAVFKVGNDYFSALLDGHASDKHCKNVNRKSSICYDPHVIFHSDSQVFHVPTVEELARSSKEKESASPRKRKRYSAEVGDAGLVVIALLEAEGKAYAEGHHNEYISCAVYLMNKCGVEEAEVPHWVAESFPDFDPVETASIVRSVYQTHADEHGTLNIRKKSKDRYAKLEDVEKFISSQASLRYNVVLGCNEISWLADEEEGARFHEISDRDENTLWDRSIKAGLLSTQNTFRSIIHSDFVPLFNSITGYLDALPEWDETTDYIGEVTARVTTTAAELFDRFFRKWFVAMIASMYEPQIVNHTILVFIGKQGIYKTSFFHHLLPPELLSFFYLKINSEHMSKDDLFTLSESVLICMEELDTLTRQEQNQLKALVSLPQIKERPAYGRNKELKPHLATFCATGNNKFFLSDDSGSRRWLNFEVLSIVDPFENPLPYEGLYAQAFRLYKSGFRYWFDNEEIAELNEHNRGFEAVNIEEELIRERFRKPHPGEKGTFVSTAHILEIIGMCIKYTLSVRKIGVIMHKLGFEEKRYNNTRGFIVVELTDTERIDIRKPDLPELPF